MKENHMTRLGYQIPNFTYPGVAANDIFGNLVQQVRTAEASGFDRVLLMDHGHVTQDLSLIHISEPTRPY